MADYRTGHSSSESDLRRAGFELKSTTAQCQLLLCRRGHSQLGSVASEVGEQAQIKEGQYTVHDYRAIKRSSRDLNLCILFCLGHSEVAGLTYHIEKTRFPMRKGGW